MGSYIYKAFEKPFDITIGQNLYQARKAKFWMKPYWDIFEEALNGSCLSYYSQSEKALYKKYCLHLGKLFTTKAVPVFILVHEDDKYKITKDSEILLFDSPKHYVVDDPNWEGAKVLPITEDIVIFRDTSLSDKLSQNPKIIHIK